MNVGSLFAGIGGFDLGFERAGMRTLWQVEIDPFCRRVLERHFPDAERYADVREVGAHNLVPVDVVCGGFPCQDISIAGKGVGITGSRSGLWGEFARIVDELRPRYVVVENVAALLRNEWLGAVLGELAALGYDAEWDCLPASAFGAPHERDRIWLVAYPDSERSELRSHRDCRPNGQDPRASQSAVVSRRDRPSCPEGCWASGDFAVANPALRWTRPRRGFESQEEGEGDGYRVDLAPPPEPLLSGMDDGLSAWLDRTRADAVTALGNALVPQIAEWIGRRLMEAERPALSTPELPDDKEGG